MQVMRRPECGGVTCENGGMPHPDDPNPPPDVDWIRTETIGHPAWLAYVTCGGLFAALVVGMVYALVVTR